MKVAIVGASGFVGTRLLEKWHLTPGSAFEPVPVVRSFGSLAVMARFELPWQVADVAEPAALAQAFAGCEGVVHAAIGDPAQIAGMADSIYKAAAEAGVKRLVVLSSSSVHGQAPEPGTDEMSPLHERHAMAYNTAKVRAERTLTALARDGRVEVTMLRPSVVFGPRSRWVADVASQLLAGRAALIRGGDGLCNTIYVDNLIHAIERALTVPQAAGETFLVGDREPVTWRDFYAEIATALGVDMATVRSVEPPVFALSLKDRVGAITAQPAVQRVLPLFPGKLKRLGKVLVAHWREVPQPNAWTLPAEVGPAMTEELSLLGQCQWRLPIAKAERLLGYEPPVSFTEGMRRSIGWLRFAGYPVAASASNA